MTQFEWKTEDEEELWEGDGKRGGNKEKANFLKGLIYVLLLGASLSFLYLAYTRFNQQVEEIGDQVDENLLSSQQLLVETVKNRDQEIFSLLLSGRDPDWTVAQQRLFENGLMYDRAPFGLHWNGDDPVATDVAVNSDLVSAVVTVENGYQIYVGNGITEEVRLTQEYVYRLGSERWLYAPPDAEFWGTRESEQFNYLHIHFPARDADIVKKLGFDLDNKLADLCQEIQKSCPLSGFEIEFTTDPQMLNLLLNRQYLLRGNNPLILPTPSIVGVSQNKAGYQALFRGYAILMVHGVLPELIGWDCCDMAAEYESYLNLLLIKLALMPTESGDSGALDSGSFVRGDGPVIELMFGQSADEAEWTTVEIYSTGEVESSFFDEGEKGVISAERVSEAQTTLTRLDEEQGLFGLTLLTNNQVEDESCIGCTWYQLRMIGRNGAVQTIQFVDTGEEVIPPVYWSAIGEVRSILVDLQGAGEE